VSESLASLNQTLQSAQELMSDIEAQAGPILDDLRITSETARNTLMQAEKAFSTEEGVPAELNETLRTARDALQQAEQTLSTVQDATANYGELRYELNNTLKDLSVAAKSLRVLTDYLQQHPEAIIRGKSPAQGE
jgi:paraquat-inducible protein B